MYKAIQVMCVLAPLFGAQAFRVTPSASLDRRQMVLRKISAGSAVLAGSFLAGAQPSRVLAGELDDFSRLTKGLEGLDFLLANWEKETTSCNPECERSPDNVRFYLGRRSTTHPLYQIEKVLNGKPLLDKVDPDAVEDFVAAVESWNTAVSQADQMAYTSIFGLYNPSGGKDNIEKYLELSRKEVVAARDALAAIIKYAGVA